MSRWLAAIAVVVIATGCNYGTGAFSCANNEQCGGAGQCESNGRCSLPDSKCPSGRAYSELAGGDSGECVTAGNIPPPPIDAGIDAFIPPDARVCFGTAPFTVCLASVPTQALTISETTTIDTATSPLCAATMNSPNLCVIAATSITTLAPEGRLRATGTRPLVLLAVETITANAAIDVGSHRGQTPEVGAGADPAAPACAAGTAPGQGAGGAGGSFVGLGGTGGNGSGTGAGTGGVAAAAVVGELRGGCKGQDGSGNNTNKGVGGHGGGAVLLIAGTQITINAGINAAGEGGTAGVTNTSGGGGGGAGGMIVLDAPTIAGSGLFLANGGGGGEGSGQTTQGDNGDDSTTVDPATGGSTMNLTNAGDGGDGSAGAVIAGGNGDNGVVDPGPPSRAGGGGGGGGAAGRIKVPAGVVLGNQVSPPAAP